MEVKIPISCILNLNNEDNSLIYNIKCNYCGGVLFNPISSKRDNKIYCKDCFYKLNSLDQNQENDIGRLYNKIETNSIQNLYRFKYYCPLCTKTDYSDKNKIEYTYDSLIVHLITCENQVILKKLCPKYECDSNFQFYLKDMNKIENLDKILLANYSLEKEIEN